MLFVIAIVVITAFITEKKLKHALTHIHTDTHTHPPHTNTHTHSHIYTPTLTHTHTHIHIHNLTACINVSVINILAVQV